MLISREYYNYVMEILQLVNSLILKTDYTADSINTVLTMNGETPSIHKEDWKYYRNLAGLPYVGQITHNSDPEDMVVYSLDTEEIVPFNVSTIGQHPQTLADLKTLGYGFKNLIAKYPMQRLLLRGIIDPIPLEVSINAQDYEILFYAKDLLDANETNVIPLLQEYIYRFVSRWDLGNYRLSDELYPASFIYILFNAMPCEIINIRLANCKTPYVHRWHVWNYLSGYFDLAKHKDVIPYGQALFLYRNIDYILANSGTSGILDFLNANFANPFNLNLSAFSIKKDCIIAQKNLNDNKLEDLTRRVSIVKHPYGEASLPDNNTLALTPANFVNTLLLTGTENHKHQEYDTKSLINNVNGSLPNDFITGVLEGNVTNDVLVDLVNGTLEHAVNWLYLTSLGMIKYKVSLELADVGISGHLINAEDAAILYLYANAKISGTNYTTIPEFWVPDVMVSDTPDISKQMGLVEKRFLSGNGFNVYDAISNSQTKPKIIQSLSEFKAHVASVVDNKFLHLLIMAQQSDFVARSETLSLCWSFYHTVRCTFTEETLYQDALGRLKLNHEQWTTATCNSVIKQITNKFMGIEVETDTLQSPYSNMLDILSQLCSYTVTFVSGVSTNYTTPVWAHLPSSRLLYVSIATVDFVETLTKTFAENTLASTTHTSIQEKEKGLVATNAQSVQQLVSVNIPVRAIPKTHIMHKLNITNIGPTYTAETL